MKIWNRIFTAVLVLGLLLIPSFDSHAEEAESYKYKVTFYAGMQGTFEDGSDKIVQADIPGESKLFFNAQSAVKVAADSKYYVKGVRLAGRDNSEAEMSTLTVDVNADLDYVIVYGIKGDQVNYTVEYQDTDGNELAESDVFYGNIGDKPVVAYKYIDGYIPYALGLTKTLSENEAENVFTFVYSRAEDGVRYEDGETTIIYNDQVISIISGGTGGGAGAVGTTGTAGENAAPEAEADQELSAENNEQGEGMQGIVDLDDEETPLGNIDLDEEEVKRGLPMAGIISLVGISILALIVAVIIALRIKERMKKY